ncbi:MAG: hypothetical protein GWO41_05780 [candidate division Zixibacteria bacterium]|nr:hypothetical protein [candidate division Zixibacteria bacterium]NIR62310.1 hypothetical protein [candidate division Zixibacteria bacterium]NIS15771.1 hypothetical protein [candidate division Zixibacteria bacterium]NIS48515.1 hypothetical protein [candidate division Zixibacteria bacterium]NIT52252.1 hypothetical protein [candidate division Zixibacteria bacterium]
MEMAKIFIITVIYGTIPLVIVSVIQAIIESSLKLHQQIPEESRAARGFELYLLQFVSDLFFFVILPTLVYYWVYPIMPFSGYKSGVAVGIAAYALGSLPYATSLGLRLKLPTPLIVSTLFFNLLKLTAALGVITHYMNY